MEKEYITRPIEVVLECPKCNIEMKEFQMYPYHTGYYFYQCPFCKDIAQNETKYPYIKYARVMIAH